MRTTLSDLKESRIPSVVNVSPDDERLISLTNEAQQRLLQTGEYFWGSHGRFQFCVTSGCLVLPRQIANVEAVALCNHPLTVRNRWFEFLGSGTGLQTETGCSTAPESSCGCGGWNLLDRGEVATHSDMSGALVSKVKVYLDVDEDSSAVITLFGYDENNQWIRTQVGGEWIDGEQITISLAATPVLSTKFYTAITGVQKPVTNGPVRLYEYNTDTTDQTEIAVYESDETRPSYRKMFLSGLSTAGCSDCEGDDSGTYQVTVMARLEFIPARVDSDWLLIGNLPALKDEIQSILKYEANLPEEGAFWHAKAIAGLRAELRHYLGRGAVPAIRMTPRNIGTAAVRNLI